MSVAWREIWALVSLIIGIGKPLATGASQFASAFETAGRVTNKAAQNWETSIDIDSVAAELELRKAKLAAEQA